VSSEIDRASLLDWLTRVLDLLSADAERQLRETQQSGVGPDEIALEFDNAFCLAQAAESEGILRPEIIGSLSAVDSQLDSMTRAGAHLWTEQAVRESSEWRQLRLVAGQAKSLMGPEIFTR
jgi:hypothetical protein